MTLNRYEDVKAFLHFVDSMSHSGDGMIKKIRPPIEQLRKHYQMVPMEEHVSVKLFLSNGQLFPTVQPQQTP